LNESRSVKDDLRQKQIEILPEEEIIEKRKLLWSSKNNKSPKKIDCSKSNVDDDDSSKKIDVCQNNENNSKVEKFKKLLGVKSEEAKNIFKEKYADRKDTAEIMNNLDAEYSNALTKTILMKSKGFGYSPKP